MNPNPIDPLIIPIVAITMPLLLVPTILILKQRHRRRELEHLERMKAMSSRQPLAAQGGGLGAGLGIAAVGAGVPAASVIAAFLTSLLWEPIGPDEVPIPAIAWVSSILISGAAMLTSLKLASVQARTVRELDLAARSDWDQDKPAFDPDTFDVVGSRG